MKFLAIFCLFCCIQMELFSQSVFALEPKKDLIIGAISIGIGIIPLIINNEPGYIPGILNSNEVNPFDRIFIFSYKRNLNLFSDNILPYAMALLPIIPIIPNARYSNTVFTYSVMYSQALLLNYGTVFTLKGVINRYRPYMYADGVPDGKEMDFHNSFPSAAASFAFLSATFFSVTFSQEFPESKWKWPVILGSYTLATGVASMRVFSGAHFLTDVLVGAAIGSIYGSLIPMLHLRKNNRNFTLTPNVNGLAISLRL